MRIFVFGGVRRVHRSLRVSRTCAFASHVRRRRVVARLMRCCGKCACRSADRDGEGVHGNDIEKNGLGVMSWQRTKSTANQSPGKLFGLDINAHLWYARGRHGLKGPQMTKRRDSTPPRRSIRRSSTPTVHRA
jgi:hypothetical protein